MLHTEPHRGSLRAAPRSGAALAAAWAALVLVGCEARRAADPSVLRIGYMPNVTHAAALSGLHRGSFERALRGNGGSPSVRIEWRAFGAGPQVVEAIYADAIDVAYLGPGPALNGYLRSRGEALVVLAGAASGGAALVVRATLGIRDAEGLRGRKLASPQIGNTQDVALRTWLGRQGLLSTDRGGDVLVTPLANPDILTLFKRGDLDGAWVPEPWVTRLVDEAGGAVLVDERSLWPQGRFPSALLCATRPALAAKPEAISRLLAAHLEELQWLRTHPDEARREVHDALVQVSGKRLPQSLIDRAMSSLELTWDPLVPALGKLAEDARALGYLPKGSPSDLDGLVDRAQLDAAVARRMLDVARASGAYPAPGPDSESAP